MGLLAKLFGIGKRNVPDVTAAGTPTEGIWGGPFTGPGGSTLYSVNKPVWSYGLEAIPGILPEKKGRVRRIIFTQLVTPEAPAGSPYQAQIEEDNRLLMCGLPLWLAEAMYFSKNCTSAVYLSLDGSNHGRLRKPWTHEELGQLVKTSQGTADYIVTGTINRVAGVQKLSLDLWSVHRLRHRHRKLFTAEWTPRSADMALMSLGEYFRLFMEWTAHQEGDGVAYSAPRRPSEWLQILSTSLSFILAEKYVLNRDRLVMSAPMLDLAAELAVTGEPASMAWLTMQGRALRLGKMEAPVLVQVHNTLLIKTVQEKLE